MSILKAFSKSKYTLHFSSIGCNIHAWFSGVTVAGYTFKEGTCTENNMMKFPAPTVALCARACNNLFECRGFVFIPFFGEDEKCVLKNKMCERPLFSPKVRSYYRQGRYSSKHLQRVNLFARVYVTYQNCSDNFAMGIK